MKHIDFSLGEVLVDDLVTDEDDIPQFSYEFGEDLRIDLDEIQQMKEMKELEAQAKNIENFEQLQYMMHNDRFSNGNYYHPEMAEGYSFNPDFIYHEEDMLNSEHGIQVR